VGKMSQLNVIPINSALLLRAERNLSLEDGSTRVAGEEWLLEGATTYIPRIEVSVVERIDARIVAPGQALKLQAKRDCVDKAYNIARKTGETWLMRNEGAYLPSADECVVELVSCVVLSEKEALHLRAKSNYVDAYDIARQAGDHWLVTLAQAKWHIVDVHEELINVEMLISLTARQYWYYWPSTLVGRQTHLANTNKQTLVIVCVCVSIRLQ
jgi:major vault protein